MPSFGRSLRVYLADGSATGVRLAEIVNWTGQAIACPRTRLNELAQWPEVSRPGVYFLIAGGLGTDQGAVYVGETENVLERLRAHVADKDFWTEAVAFTSKDSNLTKAHVRYLEQRLIELARAAGRYSLENGTDGSPVSLPRPDQDAMEEYLLNLRVVLGTLGHRVLEAFASSVVTNNAPIGVNDVLGTPLQFSFGGLSARGFATDEGFVLKEGSQIATEAAPSTPRHVLAQRESAKASGAIVARPGYFLSTKDIEFTSSSTAASFVAGSNRSGPLSWHSTDGTTLRDLEARTLPSLPVTSE